MSKQLALLGLAGVAAAVGIWWAPSAPGEVVASLPQTGPPGGVVPDETQTSPEDGDSEYATFVSRWFGVSLRYPKDWQSRYPPDQYVGQQHYDGEDGFFGIALGGSGASIEGSQAYLGAIDPALNAYGRIQLSRRWRSTARSRA